MNQQTLKNIIFPNNTPTMNKSNQHFFSRTSSYSYSNINGDQKSYIKDRFSGRDHNGKVFGKEYISNNFNGSIDESMRNLSLEEIQHPILGKGIVDRSFLIRKPDPLISIFNEPKHIFDGFYGKSDYFPRLK